MLLQASRLIGIGASRLGPVAHLYHPAVPATRRHAATTLAVRLLASHRINLSLESTRSR